MKMNDCIIEEASGLMEYKTPELCELSCELVLGGDKDVYGSNDFIEFSGREEDGENETFDLD